MDWITLLKGALTGAIITLPIALFANIAVPWVKSFFEKSSLSINERRIHILLDNYKDVKTYKLNSGIFIDKLLRLLGLMMVIAGILLFTIGLILIRTILNPSFGKTNQTLFLLGMAGSSVLLFPPYSLYFYLSGFFNRVGNFVKYKEETITELKKLGDNPEELDKIDKEIEESKGSQGAKTRISRSIERVKARYR
jgi:hypothetical protein